MKKYTLVIALAMLIFLVSSLGATADNLDYQFNSGTIGDYFTGNNVSYYSITNGNLYGGGNRKYVDFLNSSTIGSNIWNLSIKWVKTLESVLVFNQLDDLNYHTIYTANQNNKYYHGIVENGTVVQQCYLGTYSSEPKPDITISNINGNYTSYVDGIPKCSLISNQEGSRLNLDKYFGYYSSDKVDYIIFSEYNDETSSCPIEDGHVFTSSYTFPVGSVCNLPNGFIISGSNISIDMDDVDFTGDIVINGTSNSIIDGIINGDVTVNGGSHYISGNVVYGRFDDYSDYSYVINNDLSGEGTYSGTSSYSGNTVSPNSGNIVFPPNTIQDSLVIDDNESTEIIVDCNGAIIRGSYLNNSVGIHIQTNRPVTLKNCTVERYAYGIYSDSFVDSKLLYNIVTDNTVANVQLNGASSSEVYFNTIGDVNDSVTNGFVLAGSSNIIVNNTFANPNNVWDEVDNFYCDGTYDNTYLTATDGPTCVIYNAACGDVVTRKVVLSYDLECSGDGLIIGADNVEIDCDEYSIRGNYNGTGIKAIGYDNANIHDCVVHRFDTGIRTVSSEDSQLLRNILFSNTIMYSINGVTIN